MNVFSSRYPKRYVIFSFFLIIIGTVIKSLFRLASLVSWSLNTDLRMELFLTNLTQAISENRLKTR